MMYFYIGAYFTPLCRDHTERRVYIQPEQLPDDGFETEHDGSLLPFIHEPHDDPFLHPSDDDSSNTEGYSEDAFVDPGQPQVQTHSYCTPHLHNSWAGNPIRNEYFNIFDDEGDQWSPLAWQE